MIINIEYLETSIYKHGKDEIPWNIKTGAGSEIKFPERYFLWKQNRTYLEIFCVIIEAQKSCLSTKPKSRS
jgi:hypothetical protein